QIITNGVMTIPDVPLKATGSPPFNWYTDTSSQGIAARTSIGLTQDGNTMVIFTVDAAGGSVGMVISEMADFLIANYGVYNALNLDGGGSTQLAMQDPV